MTRLRSVTTRPIVAAISSVAQPMIAPTSAAAGACSNSGCMRAIRYTPAVTIVAAWIRAETGVGPSMASGNHACSGNWPDLPQAPSKSSRVIASKVGAPISPARGNTSENCTVPSERQIKKIAMARPTSPTRFIRNAFLAEVERDEVVGEHQDEHRRDEQVEVPEEPAPPGIVRHVPDRVEVDQAADPGDEQHERQRQRVQPQTVADLQGVDREPRSGAQLP